MTETAGKYLIMKHERINQLFRNLLKKRSIISNFTRYISLFRIDMLVKKVSKSRLRTNCTCLNHLNPNCLLLRSNPRWIQCTYTTPVFSSHQNGFRTQSNKLRFLSYSVLDLSYGLKTFSFQVSLGFRRREKVTGGWIRCIRDGPWSNKGIEFSFCEKNNIGSNV